MVYHNVRDIYVIYDGNIVGHISFYIHGNYHYINKHKNYQQ